MSAFSVTTFGFVEAGPLPIVSVDGGRALMVAVRIRDRRAGAP